MLLLNPFNEICKMNRIIIDKIFLAKGGGEGYLFTLKVQWCSGLDACSVIVLGPSRC